MDVRVGVSEIEEGSNGDRVVVSGMEVGIGVKVRVSEMVGSSGR